jgi:small subunit ribosomal protein S9
MSDATLAPTPAPTPAPVPASNRTYKSATGEILGTGRRKTSVARVRVRAGQGKITINDRPMDEFFHNDKQRESVLAPLVQTGRQNQVDIVIRVDGGGMTGQADACKLGIARALRRYDATVYEALRDSGMLTRDSRMKERKKYGLRGARRGTQFSKR